MKMRSWCRKALAFAASFIFMASILPVDLMATEIDSADDLTRGEKDVIYLPVIIRDYAADGMLFEWNELDISGTLNVDGKTLIMGNNAGYTLYATNKWSHLNNLSSSTIAKSTIYQNGSFGKATVPPSRNVKIGSEVQEILYGGRIRTGLVEATLGSDKKPVYRKETVDYLANYMSQTLPEIYENEDGSINMWYVMGTELEELGNRDLAQLLRDQITGLGDYEDSKEKYDAGNLKSCFDIETYYDAAFFFLTDLYRDSTGFGQTIDAYNSIRLEATEDENGVLRYQFNSAYTDTVYDQEEGIIYNTQYEDIDSTMWAFGNKIPETTFNPVPDSGYGKNSNKYNELAQESVYLPYYETTNYNLTLESHSKFIYYGDSELFFTFTGDDDVYVYINGILAMDMGGAHPITKTSIQLNSMADRLGLVDGEAYDLDFFYMERHGSSANFGIETNIKMLEPSMVTEETAFQDEILVGYGGEVDPQKDVVYQFSLTNNGEAAIHNLTFQDEKLGVSLTKDQLTLNSFTTMENLIVSRRLSDGSEDLTIVSPTEAELKSLLEEGLSVGCKLQIYGFHYRIDESEWEKDSNQKDAFCDTLITTSVASGFNIEGGEKKLNGIADYKVTERTFSYEQVHYYDWGRLSASLTEEEKDPDLLVGNDGKYALDGASEGFVIAKEDLIQTVTNAGVNLDEGEMEILLCSNTGDTSQESLINANARVDETGNIHYQTTSTGRDVFYYQVKSQDKVYGPVSVVTYTYGVADNVYVIDYDLPVELYDDEKSGFTGNDLLSLASLNPVETVSTFAGVKEAEQTYGSFKGTKNSCIYDLQKFMDGKDEAQVEIQVLEKGAKELTPETGVVLTQKITMVPANVVYYEDTFEGLTYISENGNVWTMYEGFDENGNSLAGQFQSADQDTPYGSDPAYELDPEETITLDSDASNATIHEMNITKTADVLRFTFTGTGFELISRTTSGSYAVLLVEVTEEESGEVVRQIPVITESENGDLTQIPIVAVKDLTYGSYTVNVRGAKSQATIQAGIDRILYIDGIRIYHPLTGEEEVLYYRSEEADCDFYEIKTLIEEGRGCYVDLGSDSSILTGTTMIEDRDEYGFVLTEINSLSDYLTYGPNNELYLNGTSGISLFAVSLKETETESERTIQIGAHRKSDPSFASTGAVNLVWGSDTDVIEAKAHELQLETGTEMYYRIPESDLQKGEDGSILLYIGTTESENDDEVLALTNLKLSGYELLEIEAMPEMELMNLFGQLFEVAEEPAEAENTVATITLESAKLKNNRVASGKTATLLVVADLQADTIHVQKADGEEILPGKCSVKEKDGKKIFTLTWQVEGEAGSEIAYQVCATGDNGAYSEAASVTLQVK